VPWLWTIRAYPRPVTTVSDSHDEGQSAPGDEAHTGLPDGPALPVGDAPAVTPPRNVQQERRDRNPQPEPGAAQVADHKERILNARSHFRWMGDCSSAAVVGGATVALTLMLGGLSMQPDVFMALEVIYGLLVIGATVFWWRAKASLGQDIPRTLDLGFVTGALIIETGVLVALDGQWPIMPHTGPWWNVIATALVVAITGATRRQIAEAALERLRAK